ncbi:hypothetical protein NIES2119_24075 [[Phormidium ambiguum] IAM M-71]|uniref:Uncharacterized protein n=1 Tax=[Phormidium ambiguum] IAM M-71 TaxID=454136 RepID=A0A1U7I9J1_9CYAN|nr:hypothetical protein [Phormidium ambiguum]OKH33172.1 hypothetical protein NIES2119_24075 [Phormidium ambiguum IAM M-71]
MKTLSIKPTIQKLAKFSLIVLAATSLSTVGATALRVPVAAQQTTTATSQSMTRGIAYNRLQIGGVNLSMSEVQVRKVLGQPREIKNGYMAIAGKTRTLRYPGLTINLLERDESTNNFFVYEIEADSSRYATKDGVKVSDRVSKVTSIYGRTELSETNSATTLSYPVNSTSPAYFNFTIQNGKVLKITFGDFLG